MSKGGADKVRERPGCSGLWNWTCARLEGFDALDFALSYSLEHDDLAHNTWVLCVDEWEVIQG